MNTADLLYHDETRAIAIEGKYGAIRREDEPAFAAPVRRRRIDKPQRRIPSGGDKRKRKGG